jgi:YspA, cpYpsA-related SLOG family
MSLRSTRRVLVCGGRGYADWRTMRDVLWGIHHDERIVEIIHGGASGADNMATRWATLADVPVSVVKAEWKRYGKAAGPMRNQAMLDRFHPDLVIAFPGRRGTADMVRRAEAAGVEVRRI